MLLLCRMFLVFSCLLTMCYASDIDVAIIGGGVNGFYTGTRLLKKEGMQVEVFEATDRIGGRLYTIYFPEMESIPVELGGMRFFGDHTRVRKLTEEVGLTAVPFIQGPTDNLYYLRSTRLRKTDLTDPAKLPYRLSKEEEGKTTAQLIERVISKLVPEFSTLDQKGWEAKRATVQYQGKALKDVSWINVLSSLLSPEAFQYLSDMGEFSLSSDENTLRQLDGRIAGGSSETFKVKEGYQAIPVRLAQKFAEKGGQIHLQHKLVRIEKDEKNTYQLSFETESGDVVLCKAKKVILTVSPTALDHLANGSPLLNRAQFRELLRSVSPNVLTKLFLGYHEPWWRQAGVKEGNSTTSLPIRSCYYFPSEADQGGSNKNSLLLASYQGMFSSLWRSLAGGALKSPTDVQSSAITLAQQELKLLHGLNEIPQPYIAAFQDWGQAPYYAAYYFWSVGYDPKEVMSKIRKPFGDEEIYIFTSDFSEHQGWVEGALEVADEILAEYFQ